MNVGDIVPIYPAARSKTRRTGSVDMGIITEVVGYKTTVLVNGELESWDIPDLKKMMSWKIQDDIVEAAGRNESR